MTTLIHVAIPVLAVLGLVAFLGGGVLLPLFEIDEERREAAAERKAAR